MSLICKYLLEYDQNDSSGNGLHLSNTNVVFRIIDGERQAHFDGSAYLSLQDNNKLDTLTQNLTIQFRVYPTDFSARRNPIQKAYGGEFTFTQEISGNINMYHGTGGGNTSPYNSLGTNCKLYKNRWNNVVLVKDYNNNNWYWYVNGLKTSFKTSGITLQSKTSLPLYIGRGYVSNFIGYIKDIYIYDHVLNYREINQFNNKKSFADKKTMSNEVLDYEDEDRLRILSNDNGFFDSKYNIYFHEFNETFIEDKNLVKHSDWSVNSYGSQNQSDGLTWNANGSSSESKIIETTDPFGRANQKCWQCIPDSTSGQDGGWNKQYYIDDKKRYRNQVFVKRNNSNGTTYHGCDNGGGTLNLSGSQNSNPYFWYGDLPSWNEWYLMVGIIHPSDYNGDSWELSGVYNMQGQKIYSGTEYKNSIGQTKQEMRDYLFYCTDTNTRQYFMYPRVDVMDGTEPSIGDLCKGFQNKIENYDKKEFKLDRHILNQTKIDEVVNGFQDVKMTYPYKWDNTDTNTPQNIQVLKDHQIKVLTGDNDTQQAEWSIEEIPQNGYFKIQFRKITDYPSDNNQSLTLYQDDNNYYTFQWKGSQYENTVSKYVNGSQDSFMSSPGNVDTNDYHVIEGYWSPEELRLYINKELNIKYVPSNTDQLTINRVRFSSGQIDFYWESVLIIDLDKHNNVEIKNDGTVKQNNFLEI